MKNKPFTLTPGIYMWDTRHFRKCANCGKLIGQIGFPECSAGPVACDMQPTREFKDLRQFAWMAIQDKMWRYASWYKERDVRDRAWEEMAIYYEQVKAIMDDLIKMSRKRKIIIKEYESNKNTA